MTLQEKILYHQIHPWKLAADIGGWAVSMYFFWQHDLLLGLAIQFVPAILASLLVIRYAGLEAIKNSKAGAIQAPHDADDRGSAAGWQFRNRFRRMAPLSVADRDGPGDRYPGLVRRSAPHAVVRLMSGTLPPMATSAAPICENVASCRYGVLRPSGRIR